MTRKEWKKENEEWTCHIRTKKQGGHLLAEDLFGLVLGVEALGSIFVRKQIIALVFRHLRLCHNKRSSRQEGKGESRESCRRRIAAFSKEARDGRYTPRYTPKTPRYTPKKPRYTPIYRRGARTKANDRKRSQTIANDRK
jgi:hypothetical protein